MGTGAHDARNGVPIMTTTTKTTLPEAIDAVWAAKRTEDAGHPAPKRWLRAARALDGAPVGGWGETEQGRHEVAEALPQEAGRDFSIGEFVDAMYYVDHADRYRALVGIDVDEYRIDRNAYYGGGQGWTATMVGESRPSATVTVAADGTVTVRGGSDPRAVAVIDLLMAGRLELRRAGR